MEKFLRILQDVPKEIEIPEFPAAEILINFIAYCASFGLSWSEYFLAYTSGRAYLYQALIENKFEGVMILYQAVHMTWVTKNYDEKLFRRDLFNAFPDIGKYLGIEFENTYLQNVALFVFGMISFHAFKLAITKIYTQTYARANIRN